MTLQFHKYSTLERMPHQISQGHYSLKHVFLVVGLKELTVFSAIMSSKHRPTSVACFLDQRKKGISFVVFDHQSPRQEIGLQRDLVRHGMVWCGPGETAGVYLVLPDI